MTGEMQLTKNMDIQKLIVLLYGIGWKEAADDLASMVMGMETMEERMDAALEELAEVKERLSKMEENEAAKGLKGSVHKAADRLEQECHAAKEKLLEVKAEIKTKVSEIVAAVKWRGKAAFGRVSELLQVKEKLEGIHRHVEGSIAGIDRSVEKLDAFGAGMREASRKIANTFRIFAGRPEKEYGEKRFSKTEMVKKLFLGERKLLCGVLDCTEAVIEKIERLAKDFTVYQMGQSEQRRKETAEMKSSTSDTVVKASKRRFEYGAEMFEAYENAEMKKAFATMERKQEAVEKEPTNLAAGKSR